MIDTHCHIDLHDNPVGLAKRIQASESECVAVTMLPSHFRLGMRHLAPFRNIHSALGLHPLRVEKGRAEVEDFATLSRSCEFIGEIGLDFSRQGAPTKGLQMEVFLRIIDYLRRDKFVSVHSRGAGLELLEIITEKKVGPVCFHYFTAGLVVAAMAVESGHFFSFNRRMLNGKHKDLLGVIPKDRVLVESDGPFLTTSPVTATKYAYAKIAKYWDVSLSEAEETIARNFANCRTQG